MSSVTTSRRSARAFAGLLLNLVLSGALLAAASGRVSASDSASDRTDAAPDYGEHAADHHYAPARMAAARAAVHEMHGGTPNWMLLGERFELGADDEFVWEAEGWYGGQLNRLWLKTDGEADLHDGTVGEAELQALFSRAIRPFWDLQLGVRHDFEPQPTRTHAVVGIKGLAPYLFEIDSALFLSEKGDLSGRIEAEYELRLGQRLFLQPRAELDFAFSDDAAVGVGSGIGEVEFGLRLRYEIRRDLAPYIGYQWTKKYGRTAELAAATSSSAAVLGIRFWL